VRSALNSPAKHKVAAKARDRSADRKHTKTESKQTDGSTKAGAKNSPVQAVRPGSGSGARRRPLSASRTASPLPAVAAAPAAPKEEVWFPFVTAADAAATADPPQSMPPPPPPLTLPTTPSTAALLSRPSPLPSVGGSRSGATRAEELKTQSNTLTVPTSAAKPSASTPSAGAGAGASPPSGGGGGAIDISASLVSSLLDRLTPLTLAATPSVIAAAAHAHSEGLMAGGAARAVGVEQVVSTGAGPSGPDSKPVGVRVDRTKQAYLEVLAAVSHPNQTTAEQSGEGTTVQQVLSGGSWSTPDLVFCVMCCGVHRAMSTFGWCAARAWHSPDPNDPLTPHHTPVTCPHSLTCAPPLSPN
jgi:hypothetical protein